MQSFSFVRGAGWVAVAVALPAAARAEVAASATVDLGRVFLWSLLPVAATLCGIVVAVSRPPGMRVRSALQHLAAGIVFAAVATEIVPEMLEGSQVAAVASGFSLGVLLMFGVRVAIDVLERGSASASSGGSGWSMIVATGIDLAIDGLLIGLGFAISASSGILLTIAVAFEVLFVSIGLSATLGGRGRSRRFTVCVLGGMAAVTAVSMWLGASLLADLDPIAKVFVLSFGSAALLYLVSEELLVDAHEAGADTVAGSMLFFVGFGASLIGAMLL